MKKITVKKVTAKKTMVKKATVKNQRVWAILMTAFFGPLAFADAPNAVSPTATSSVQSAMTPRAQYELDESEYEDLVTYVHESQETLTSALREASTLGGERLYQHLSLAVQTALDQSDRASQIDASREVLLFREVLGRGQDLVEVIEAGVTDRQALFATASVVLDASIKLAIRVYLASDEPRLGSGGRIPAPNWLSFALESISPLMGLANIAPTAEVHRQFVSRSLGFTAYAINQSLQRRSWAEDVVRLVQHQERLRTGLISVGRAQAALVFLGQRIAEARERGNPFAPEESDTASVGIPRSDAQRIREDSNVHFPLISVDYPDMGGISFLQPGNLLTVRQGNRSHTLTHQSFSLEVGAGYQADIDLENGDVSHYGVVSARANAIFSWAGVWERTRFRHNASTRELTPVTTPEVDWAYFAAFGRADVGGNSSGPVYDFSLDASGGALVAFHAWVAVEARQFAQFQEAFVRAGWSPGIQIRLQGGDYILLQLRLGYAHQIASPNGRTFFNQEARFIRPDAPPRMPDGGAVTTGFHAAMRLNRTLFVLSGEVDQRHLEAGSPRRIGFNIEATIPLDFIVEGDALRINLRHRSYLNADYEITPGSNDLHVLSGSGFYEIRW